MLLFNLWACSSYFNAQLELRDVNPTSATYNSFLSLQDYQGTVSAWYFGHAT